MDKLKTSVLTQMIFDKNLYLDNASKLTPDLFGELGFIFTSLVELIDHGQDPSIQLVSQNTGRKEYVQNFLYDSSTSLDFSKSFDDELELLIENYKELRITQLVYKLKIDLPRKSSNQVIDQTIEELLKIRTHEHSSYKKSIELLPEIDRLIDLNANGESRDSIPTGFTDIDNFTSGLQKGEYTLLAGRPGMGKTSLAIQIAKNAAQKGFKAAILSLEMSDLSLMLRIVSTQTSNVSAKSIKRDKLNRSQINQVQDAYRYLDIPLFISRPSSFLPPVNHFSTQFN